MADDQKIIVGSFKGVPITIDGGSLDAGRKLSTKQFPNRDTQSIEDLGLQPREYRLEIIVSDKQNQDYFQYRDALIAVLEQGGPGVLIHPLYGRLEDMVARPFTLNENFSEFGRSILSVAFAPSLNAGIPQASGSVTSQIAASNDVVQNSILDDITDNFLVNAKFAGNFGDAVNKVTEIVDAAENSSSFIGEEAQNLNEFVDGIGKIQANINGLVNSPSQLGATFKGLFNEVNGLYSDAAATFETFTGFFDFGSTDVAIRQDTAGRVQRENNNEVLNGSVAASSLAYAYESATKIDYETTEQIDSLTIRLDEQYEAVQESGSSQEVKDSVTDMRIKTLDALDDARVDAKSVITVQTNPTTSRLLAFSYYGNDDEGQSIVDLNSTTDVSFVSGDTKVLTA